MFCPKCGKEIPEGNKFCIICGSSVEEDINEAGEKTKNPIIIAIIIIGILVTVLLAAIIFMVIKKDSRKDYEAQVINEASDEKLGEKSDGNVTENGASEEISEEALSSEAASQETLPAAEPQLLVAVPTESMSLRMSAGLGDDVISEITAGMRLDWYGEMVADNDRDFYKVVVRDTQQTGFVPANFCVSVNYEYNDSDLSIVETDNALYTYEMMVNDISALCSKYPNALSSEIVGYSLDGRGIYEVMLGNPNAQNHIMLQASIHGREYMNTQLVMKLIEYYAYYYDTASYNDVAYSELFNNTAFHIVPMANPDGVTISQFGTGALNDAMYAELIYECYLRDKETLAYREDMIGDMAWSDHYKEENYDREAAGDYREITFDEYTRIWKANAAGVDLNKNFDAGWYEIEAKQEPAYSDYKGAYAFSEPETCVLGDIAQSRNYTAYISYHSKGQLIYYDVEGNNPDTSIQSENFATRLEKYIKYTKVNTQKGYNVSLGGFSDWIQLSMNKPSVTIESGKHQCPLEAYEFKSIWLRHRESWAMLANSMYIY